VNRIDFNKLAQIGAEVFMQYGRQLLGIVEGACKANGCSREATFLPVNIQKAMNDIQDQSFRLGLLAGMRLGENSPMKEFLEGEVEKIEKGQISIGEKWLRAAFHIPQGWKIIAAVWDSAAGTLKLCVMGEGVPLGVEVVDAKLLAPLPLGGNYLAKG
jgi:hypothetical protein